ncbi:hypothetical protein Z959_10935 [Clostridium novyi B str. ATCC 27606]|uniref:Rho-GAP domain-containing protein n=2 Tax=Clostridium TaxID=1485 RepID=A0AA40IW05_CLONO|nr:MULTISPECIES: hypothetical protein [Clostridium]KEI12324.1 hypothetical protein Z958_07995 [Clostridium novyi B str. NCTC 9691]KEI17444.1 hypothetical protein Z960_06200 [Clostridium haemolyticum NCTC 9693]KEI18410.1 hypothetical protein Z959_10935 [Clostridium novyi B str. ATCC 27606]KGN04295.1 hypothetical protein Z961_03720 [Clostridium haemolyticum NCTC 8350]OOB75946.1 hypothetical protein AXF41_05625 [Clostridium haemolyticum]
MKDYSSQLPETRLTRDNMTSFYSNNKTLTSMEEIEFGSNNIHTVEDSYEQKEKLKEILNKSLR